MFPLALNDWAGPFDWPRFGHFAVSFTVSGLIALKYSFLSIQYVVVRGLYPRLTHPEMSPAQLRSEADRLTGELGWVPVAAAVVPLTAAVIQTAVAPTEFTLGFRLLVTALIVTGMIGLGWRLRPPTG